MIPGRNVLRLAGALLLLSAGSAAAACPPGEIADAQGVCKPRPRASPTRGFSLARPLRPSPPRLATGVRASRLAPVRMFLEARDIPPSGVGAYGVVALRGLPTAASAARLKRVCEAFVKYLPRSASLPSSVTIAQKMVTAWPVDHPDAPQARADDCDYLTAHYDLYGGLSAIQDASAQGADLGGRGPFLIGWSPSSSRGVRDKVVLVYDMSQYESQDSFDRAFIWWQQKVVSDPKLWSDGWSFEQVRISVRDFFDQYATSALDAIKLVGGQ